MLAQNAPAARAWAATSCSTRWIWRGTSCATSCGRARKSLPSTPRPTLAECLEVAEKTRYSRFPLCEGGDLDKTLGVVHIKDLFAIRFQAARGADLARWRAN